MKKVLKTEEELEEALATVDSNRSGATNNLEQEKSDSENDNSKPLSSSTQNLCAICSTETSGPHKCRNCGEIVHLRCAQSTSGTSTNDDEEGFEASILCLRCAQTISATINKEVAYEGLRVQAEKMKQLSQKKFPEIQVGESVTVPVSSLDRGKGDARNILGVVMEKTADGFYKIGTKHGVISSLYARNQIQSCKEQFFKIEDVPNIELSLREISGHSSSFGGQGFQRCNCTKKCTTNSCKCKRLKLLCNSKCHHSTSCTNK